MRLRFPPPPHSATATSGPGLPHYRGLTITLRHTAFGRTPLDGSSARRRDLYLTTHNTPKGQTSMVQAEFEPVIPASERLQTHALDRAATGKGTNMWLYLPIFFISKLRLKRLCSVLWLSTTLWRRKELSHYRPVQSHRAAGGLPDFLDSSAHEGVKVVSPTHRPPLPLRLSPLYSFPLVVIKRSKSPVYRPGVAQRVPGSYGSQISWQRQGRW